MSVEHSVPRIIVQWSWRMLHKLYYYLVYFETLNRNCNTRGSQLVRHKTKCYKSHLLLKMKRLWKLAVTCMVGVLLWVKLVVFWNSRWLMVKGWWWWLLSGSEREPVRNVDHLILFSVFDFFNKTRTFMRTICIQTDGVPYTRNIWNVLNIVVWPICKDFDNSNFFFASTDSSYRFSIVYKFEL